MYHILHSGCLTGLRTKKDSGKIIFKNIFYCFTSYSRYYENKFENEYIKLFFKSLPFISRKSSLRKSHQTEVLILLYCLNFYYKVYTLNRLICLFNKYFLSSMMLTSIICVCVSVYVCTKLTHDAGSYMEAHYKKLIVEQAKIIKSSLILYCSFSEYITYKCTKTFL